MANWQPWVYPGHWSMEEHNAVLAALRKAEAELDRMGKANNEACDRIAELEADYHILQKDRDFYRDEYQPVSAVRDKAEARVRELEAARSPRKAVAAQNVRLSPVHYAQTPHGFEVIQECDPDSYIAFTTSETDARMTAAEFNGLIQRCEKAEARVKELEAALPQPEDIAGLYRVPELQARIAELETQLAAVTAERDEARVACARVGERITELLKAMDALKEERDALRAELADRTTHPCRVRFDVTADEFNTHFSQIDRALFEPEVIELIFSYLAAHAVVDVPPGECQECAEKQTVISGLHGAIKAFESAARAALEGEA